MGLLVLLSPAKTQNLEVANPALPLTKPALIKHSLELVEVLREYDSKALAKLMKISAPLAVLNVERYAKFSRNFNAKNSRAAITIFQGDVYKGIDLGQYQKKHFNFAQKHLRILSGLYGSLRPLDLVQPYRLEMKTNLRTTRGRNLYQFWSDLVTASLANDIKKERITTLINLASNEYSKVINFKELDVEVITPIFQEKKAGQFRTVALFAKQARGLMADFIIRNQLITPERLKEFQESRYSFTPSRSKSGLWVFAR